MKRRFLNYVEKKILLTLSLRVTRCGVVVIFELSRQSLKQMFPWY